MPAQGGQSRSNLDIRLTMLGLAMVALAVALAPVGPQRQVPGATPGATEAPPTPVEAQADKIMERDPIEVTVRQAALIENPLNESGTG